MTLDEIITVVLGGMLVVCFIYVVVLLIAFLTMLAVLA